KMTYKLFLVVIISAFLYACNNSQNFPEELKVCFEYLDENWDEKEIEIFKNLTQNDPSPPGRDYHFGIGLHLRNYLLHDHVQSEYLVGYFNRNGIFHFDDMSGFILTSYHAYLNNETFDLDKEFQWRRASWEPTLCEIMRDSIAWVNFNRFQ